MTNESLHEVEFKYVAKLITHDQLIQAVTAIYSQDYTEVIRAYGTDTYFGSSNPTEFLRYREDIAYRHAELTYKRKLSSDNSYVRVEVDLPIDITSHDKADISLRVKNLASLLGYKELFSIEKDSLIIRTGQIDFALYTVDGKDQYLEIETNKKLYHDTDRAITVLEYVEATALSLLGLSKADRINKNLFEIYGPIKAKND